MLISGVHPPTCENYKLGVLLNMFHLLDAAVQLKDRKSYTTWPRCRSQMPHGGAVPNARSSADGNVADDRGRGGDEGGVG
jgi:hypothetical protein